MVDISGGVDGYQFYCGDYANDLVVLLSASELDFGLLVPEIPYGNVTPYVKANNRNIIGEEEGFVKGR